MWSRVPGYCPVPRTVYEQGQYPSYALAGSQWSQVQQGRRPVDVYPYPTHVNKQGWKEDGYQVPQASPHEYSDQTGRTDPFPGQNMYAMGFTTNPHAGLDQQRYGGQALGLRLQQDKNHVMGQVPWALPHIGVMSLYHQGSPPVDRAPNKGVQKAPGGGGIESSGCQMARIVLPPPEGESSQGEPTGFPLLSPLPLVYHPNLAPLALNPQILG